MLATTIIKKVNKKNNDVTPPLKWVVGKRKIIDVIESASQGIETPFTYYEPFFGGGAIFFSLFSKGFIQNAYLNDVVPQVVNFYNVLSDQTSRGLLKVEARKIEKKFNNLNLDIERRKIEYTKFRETFNDNWENFILESKNTKLDFVSGNQSSNNFDSKYGFPHGIVPAGIHIAALKKICNLKISTNTDTGYKEFFTKYDFFKTKFIFPESDLNISSNLRLTLDYEEDF